MRKSPWVLVAGGFHRQGGMDKANFALAEYLLSQNTTVHLVTHSAENCLSVNPHVHLHLVPRPLGSIALGGPFLNFRGRAIASSVTAGNSDAVVLTNGGNCIWPGVNWAHYIHAAWRPDTNGSWSVNDLTKKVVHYVDRWFESAAFLQARTIIANSDVTRNHLIQDLGISPGKVKTIYLGSDPDWLPASRLEKQSARKSLEIPEKRYQAVFVGALGHDNRKGLDTLLKAWQSLCADATWDVDLLIAGDGPALPAWRTAIGGWGLPNRVRFLGFCNEIPRLLAASDLLVSPVRYEAYGLNVHEAICCGLPAIVSASAGVAERYPQDVKDLILSNPEDVHELINCLKRWRSDAELWPQRFGPLASLLRRHTWRDAAREVVSAVLDDEKSNLLVSA